MPTRGRPRNAGRSRRSPAGSPVDLDRRRVEPWSAERPTLYPLTVTLRSPDGAVVEQATIQVGFRRVEIGGSDLLINGQRVFIRGVNRHDFDQHTGRVITPDAMRADLVLMKQFGFNAVRTSHYPNDPAFLDLTDELGLYVIDEADIESHAFQSTLCDDPRYLGAVGRPRLADGPARQEPPVGHRLVARQRVRPRRQPRGRGRVAARATTRRRPLHYEGAIRCDWTSDQRLSAT